MDEKFYAKKIVLLATQARGWKRSEEQLAEIAKIWMYKFNYLEERLLNRAFDIVEDTMIDFPTIGDIKAAVIKAREALAIEDGTKQALGKNEHKPVELTEEEREARLQSVKELFAEIRQRNGNN